MSDDSLRSSRRGGLTLADFEIQGVLGEGSYGFVLLATRKGEELVLKEMSKHRLKKVHSQHIALIEKELVRNMKHPGIVSGSSAFQSSSKLYLVLEYCGGGEFQQCVLRPMKQQSRRFYFAELVNIVEYLHKVGIVHRDIKPANLLFTYQGHLKLIDFGTACVEQCTILSPSFLEALSSMKLGKDSQEELPEMIPRIRKRKSTFVGTSQYMPPELIIQNTCEPASDLWAIGCILYFLYYGQCPFEDSCQLVVFQKIKTGKFQFPQNQQLGQDAKDLISRLLLTNPMQRLGSGYREDLTFKAFKQHPYFYGIDVDNVFSLKPPDFISQESSVIRQLSVLQSQENKFAKANVLVLFLAKKLHHVFKIFKCIFQKEFQLQQYEIQGLSEMPIVSKISLKFGQQIAKELTNKKLLINVINEQGLEQKIFFYTLQAKQFTKKINIFYQSSKKQTNPEDN